MSATHGQSGGLSWFRNTIAGKITVRMVAIATVPVLAVGALTTGSLFALANQVNNQLSASQTELARQTIGGVRAEQTSLFLDQLDRFFGERFDDLLDWSGEDIVVTTTLADYDQVAEIATWSPPVIEARFSGADQLDRTGTAERYLLSRLSGASSYNILRLTDESGFTLGTTNESDDFAHSTQDWWKAAWANGAYLGPVVADQASGTLTFELAVRVDGKPGGRPSGVLYAMLEPAVLRPLADDFANSDEQIELWLMTEDGRLLLETASDHDPARLGTRPSLRTGIDELYQQAIADDTSGSLVTDTGVGGYGWSSPSRSIERLGTDIATPRLLAFSEQPAAAALAPLGALDELGANLDAAAITMALIVAGLIALTLVLAFWVSRLLAHQITEPLRVLGAEARRMSESELPSLVHALRSTDGSGEVPVVDLIDIDADGEVAELANAFNSLRATTVELAATQAIDRSKDLAGVLVNLGRRNQHLIGRQLQFIDRLEATESDPDVLDNLFTLDQMATRMRRNAESLLVLAGERVARHTTEPQPIHEVLRAASSEVEHYTRVSLRSVEPALVAPKAVSDLTHLLAELIENATHFSPLDTIVEVIGSWDDRSCYTVSVVDHGPGMSRLKLAEANARISQNTFDEPPTSYLGLFVVGRLAARHYIDARLIESAVMGTTAKVTLPARCVSSVVETDDDGTGTRLQATDPSVGSETQWPLPRRHSLPVPAPEHTTGRLPKVPASASAGSGPGQLMIDEIEEALELPEYDDVFASDGADDSGSTKPAAAEQSAEATVSTSEAIGLPIPPFRTRTSKVLMTQSPRKAGDRSHPSNPAFRQGATLTPGSHLEIVSALPEVDLETRASAVRDRLSQFTGGVAAAKAEVAATEEALGSPENREQSKDVVPFRKRANVAGVTSTKKDEPS